MTIAPERPAPLVPEAPASFSDVDAMLSSMLTVGGFQPVKVAEVELTHGLRCIQDLAAGWTDYSVVLAVVKVHSQPLGLAVLDLGAADPRSAWTAEITRAFGGDARRPPRGGCSRRCPACGRRPLARMDRRRAALSRGTSSHGRVHADGDRRRGDA